MANKGRGYSKKQKYDNDIVFSDLRLTSEQKNQFRQLEAEEKSALIEDVFKMVANGHKLSVAYVESSDSYIASVTCKLETHINFNVCLTSYADNAWDAMALAAFKTKYCCPEGEWMQGEADDKLR